jgi:hypothetical protein
MSRTPKRQPSRAKRTRAKPSRPLVDLAWLDTLPIDEIRTLWRAYGGRGSPPQPRLMIRQIAFTAQAHVYSDFDPLTRRLLKLAMRDAFNEHDAAPARSDPAPSTTPASERRPPTPSMSAPLPSGARLVRVWRDRTHEVTVVENGNAFVYEGTTYRSLSSVAKAITGSVWSGPKFFGLTGRAALTPRKAEST